MDIDVKDAKTELTTRFPHPFVCSCLQGMLVFIISGLVILAYCSQASNERTYQEVVWAVCGKLTGVLCEVAIAVYTFGTCIAFLIIIGDQQDKSEVLPPARLFLLGLSSWGRGERVLHTRPCPLFESCSLEGGLRTCQSQGATPCMAWHDIRSFFPVQL